MYFSLASAGIDGQAVGKKIKIDNSSLAREELQNAKSCWYCVFVVVFLNN